VAERDRIQPGQPVAAAGVAEGNRYVIINQFAATAGEDGRVAGKACPLLLAIVGGEPSDVAPVRKHAAADGGSATASRVGAAAMRNQSGRWGVDEEVSEKSLRNGANHGFLVPAKAVWRTTGSLALEPMQKKIASGGKWGILVRSRKAKRKFRLMGSSLPFSPPPSVGIRTSFLE
jgi:hypothetical protein